MSREDPDIAEAMQGILSEEGIRFVLSAEPVAVQADPGKASASPCGTPAGMMQTIEASVPLGRIPNTASIGLQAVGVGLDARASYALTNGWRRQHPSEQARSCDAAAKETPTSGHAFHWRGLHRKTTYVSFATSPGSNVGPSPSTDSTRMFDDGGH